MAPRARRTTCAAVLLGSFSCSDALRVGVMRPDVVPVRTSPPFMLDPMAAKPLGNMVLVELEKEPAQSTGGILMPTAFSEDPNDAIDQFKPKEVKKGRVLEVGPGRLSDDGKAVASVDFTPGQSVVVAPVDGIKVEPNGPSPETSVFLFKSEEVWATA
eukprot:scaffold307580_cov40-Tisochrysis_lutea.AAC.2